MNDKTRTVEVFNNLLQQQQTPTLNAYTDGSLSNTTNTTTCAIVIPELKVEEAWTLRKHSSIFTAELMAIKQALQAAYNLDSTPAALAIFSDSSSAIQAISSCKPSGNEVITQIRELLDCLRSSGTRTTLTWIPSHTGIEGNELADRLAVEECTKTSSKNINNDLSPSEKSSICKDNWKDNQLQSLKTCRKKCIQMKTSLKPIKWHQHSDRKVAVSLHRLRSGHHYLNSFNHRIDPEADPSCRYGCEAIENPQHILETCPRNEIPRRKIRQFFSDKKLEFNFETMIGLNPTLDTSTQLKIRNLTAKFLIKTSLTDII